MRVEDFYLTKQSVVSTAGANAAATATITAPAAGNRIVVTGISVSANGAPASAVEVTLNEDTSGANTKVDAFFLPAAQFTPIVANYKQPLRIAAGKNCVLTIPALGAGVTGRAVVKYSITSV